MCILSQDLYCNVWKEQKPTIISVLSISVVPNFSGLAARLGGERGTGPCEWWTSTRVHAALTPVAGWCAVAREPISPPLVQVGLHTHSSQPLMLGTPDLHDRQTSLIKSVCIGICKAWISQMSLSSSKYLRKLIVLMGSDRNTVLEFGSGSLHFLSCALQSIFSTWSRRNSWGHKPEEL